MAGKQYVIILIYNLISFLTYEAQRTGAILGQPPLLAEGLKAAGADLESVI